MSVFKEDMGYKKKKIHVEDWCNFWNTLKEKPGRQQHAVQQPLYIEYDRAKLLLEQHYWDSHEILTTHRKKIKIGHH